MSCTLTAEVSTFLTSPFADGLTTAERFLLMLIADRAHTDTREAWQGGKAGWDPSKIIGVRLAPILQRLAHRGIDVRVQIGTDSTGRPVFARRGWATRFRVPVLPGFTKSASSAMPAPVPRRTMEPAPVPRRTMEPAPEPAAATAATAATEPMGDTATPSSSVAPDQTPSDTTTCDEFSTGGYTPVHPDEFGYTTVHPNRELGRTTEQLGCTTVHPIGSELQKKRTSSHACAREPWQLIGASDDERDILLKQIKKDHNPKNVDAYAAAMHRSGDLANRLADLRAVAARETTRAVIAEARASGDVCDHGFQGGAAIHPASGLPMCPLCRQDVQNALSGRVRVSDGSVDVVGTTGHVRPSAKRSRGLRPIALADVQDPAGTLADSEPDYDVLSIFAPVATVAAPTSIGETGWCATCYQRGQYVLAIDNTDMCAHHARKMVAV